jgi:hypothetical protein
MGVVVRSQFGERRDDACSAVAPLHPRRSPWSRATLTE